MRIEVKFRREDYSLTTAENAKIVTIEVNDSDITYFIDKLAKALVKVLQALKVNVIQT